MTNNYDGAGTALLALQYLRLPVSFKEETGIRKNWSDFYQKHCERLPDVNDHERFVMALQSMYAGVLPSAEMRVLQGPGHSGTPDPESMQKVHAEMRRRTLAMETQLRQSELVSKLSQGQRLEDLARRHLH